MPTRYDWEGLSSERVEAVVELEPEVEMESGESSGDVVVVIAPPAGDIPSSSSWCSSSSRRDRRLPISFRLEWEREESGMKTSKTNKLTKQGRKKTKRQRERKRDLINLRLMKYRILCI